MNLTFCLLEVMKNLLFGATIHDFVVMVPGPFSWKDHIWALHMWKHCEITNKVNEINVLIAIAKGFAKDQAVSHQYNV